VKETAQQPGKWLSPGGATKTHKHFDVELFVESRMPWNVVQQFNNRNICWNVWKSFLKFAK